MYIAILANSVDAPDSLLDAHGIPGQIVVNQRSAELKISTFAACLRTDKHRGAFFELLNYLVLLNPLHATVETNRINALSLEESDNKVVRMAETAEDNHFIVEGFDNLSGGLCLLAHVEVAFAQSVAGCQHRDDLLL